MNPKSWMKAATLAAVFMPPGLQVAQGALVVSLVGLVVGFPLISVWTLFGARAEFAQSLLDDLAAQGAQALCGTAEGAGAREATRHRV